MRKVAVIGVGNSKFDIRGDVNVSELAFEAFKPSLEEAGLTAKEDLIESRLKIFGRFTK